MTPELPTRREFLKHSSLALAAGTAMGGFSSRALSDPNYRNASGALKQFQGAVACSRREAADAARGVLREGGNAIDAAAAALLVQCVVEPWNVGLGGYGGSLVVYRAKTSSVHAIDFTSRAPRRIDPAKLTKESARHGYLAIGAPGILAGIDRALHEYGTMPFKALAKHAHSIAEEGTTVTPALAAAFKNLNKTIDPVSRRAYLPDGVPAKGARWPQKDLASLIRRLGDEGPMSFYKGDIAATIARQVQANGGVLDDDDFHDFNARVVEPLHVNYRGYDLYTPPLPSGGLTSLSILKTLEQFDLSKLRPWGPRYIELFAGASNLTWGERYEHFGDPDFVKVPVEELLSEERAISRAEPLRNGTPTVPAPPSDASHTVNLAVMDSQENIVSWTATHGDSFGSHVAIEGLGLMLGHTMSRFDLDRGSPNYPAPQKRPQHNMCPLLVLADGKPYAALGLVGGPRIVTVTAQLAINLIDFKAGPQEVVSAPRIHTEGTQPTLVTRDTPRSVVDELNAKGHRVEVRASLGGPANAIVINRESGEVRAASSHGSTGAAVF